MSPAPRPPASSSAHACRRTDQPRRHDRSRLASCALAALYNYWRREGRAFDGEPREALLTE